MLYDKRWDAKVEVDPFTIEGIIVWLEKQPADRSYEWRSVTSCLACQYYQSLGYKQPFAVIKLNGMTRAFGSVTAYHAIAGTRPYTFGAALKRARAAL